MTPFQHESIVLFAPRPVVERAAEHSMRVNTIHCTLEYGSEDLWQIMLLLSIEPFSVLQRSACCRCNKPSTADRYPDGLDGRVIHTFMIHVCLVMATGHTANGRT